MRPRSFWVALAAGVASSVAAALCLTATYYETRVVPDAEAQAAREVVDEAFEGLRRGEDTGLVQVDPDIMVLPVSETESAREWRIAGGFFAVLAVAAFAFAVARRPRLP